MKQVSRMLEDQRDMSFIALKKGRCTILMQDDHSGKIKKYSGYCEPSKYGQKLIFCTVPYEDNHTTLEYRQKGQFASNRGLKTDSVYETKKHFVRNETYLDKDLNVHCYHTYMKKNPKREQDLNKFYGKPVQTKKHGRVWH